MDQGWSWLVSGSKLFIWKFREHSTTHLSLKRGVLSPCFELRIPQSGLVHRADLVDVFFMPQNLNTSARATTVPAALLVSPEGIIRFWSNVANERYTESLVTEVHGQEFCSLTPLSQLDYILGTTTGAVYILTIDINANNPKSVIVCAPLETSSGLLNGIGRRVSNLFFGPNSTESNSDMKRPLIAVPKYSNSTIEKNGSTERPFFVMSSNFKIRQWSRANDGINGINHMIREWDIQRSVQEKLSEILGDSINFWPIDLITTKGNELLFMIVTHDPARDNTIRYATCVFNPYQAGETLTSLTVLRSHSWRYSNESEEQLLSLRFLERRITSPVCFLYDRKFLFLVNINQDILDAIDYGNQIDVVLGAGMIDGHPILFTKNDGLIYVAPVVSNTSRLNDTSIQLDHQPNISINSTTNNSMLQTTVTHNSRIEPMIVELDEGDDEEDDEKDHEAEPMHESEWCRLIAAKQYNQASQVLAKLAENDLPEGRKETFMALSKLAKLVE